MIVVLLKIFVMTFYDNLFKGATSRYFESFLRHLNYGLSVWKPKNNGLLRKKNTKGLILKQKVTRIAEDGED